MVVQQETADKMVVLAVGLLFGVKSPEGRCHQWGLLQGVEDIHRGSVGQVESHQLRDPEPGCGVQRRVLTVVLTRRIHIQTFAKKNKKKR